MSRLEGVFDRSGALKRPPLTRVPLEFASFLTYRPEAPSTADMPDGEGHRVLVIPGLMTVDAFTAGLRQFLSDCGYAPRGWSRGVNLGPTTRDIEALQTQLAALNDKEGGPVSVVGVSMGGIIARLLAHDMPGAIRRLVTIVSPTHLPTASHTEPLVRALARLYDETIDPDDYNTPLVMPSLALFSRDDGLIAWESCKGRDENCTSVEVSGAHTTICRNPDVLREVTTFLAPGALA